MRGRARRLFVLRFGAELVPKSLSIAGGGDNAFWSPITGALVETDEGWVLYDSGMRRANHDDRRVDDVYRLPGVEATTGEGAPPAFLAEPDAGRWTWGLRDDPLVTALDEVGLSVADLSLAVVSHLHWDHAGGIGTLARAGVPVVMHEDEIALARSGETRFEEGMDSADWAPLEDGWTSVSGDTEIAPGVLLLATPGHTPGHLSVQLELPDTGSWLFPGDAAELAQNFIDVRPCGSTTASSPGHAEASLRKLVVVAGETRARIVSGHDPVVTHAAGHPPGGHR